jgi:glycosyltransferase involved in cell wall biosynthesis
MNRISAALIIRDDASTLRPLLESIRGHVDEICVLDTGSVDDSPRIAREFGAKVEVWTGCNDAEGRIADFAAARNRSFAMASHDWVCWFDGDDVVRGAENLRVLTEQAPFEQTMFMLPYEYAHDSQGRVTLLQYRERLMRPRARLEWQSPVHEVCMPRQPVPGSFGYVASDLVTVVHRQPQSTKTRETGRNLRILKAYVGTSEGDHRALYYLGLEYARNGDLGKALKYLKRYIEIADSGKVEVDQKAKAMLEVGNIYSSFGDLEQAIEWTNRATLLRRWPDPYFQLGELFYKAADPTEMNERRQLTYEQGQNLGKAASFFQQGLQFAEDPILFTDPMQRKRIHQLLHVCLSAHGDLDGAIASCKAGLDGREDPHISAALKLYENAKRRRTVDTALRELEQAGELTAATAGLVRAALSGEIAVESMAEPAKWEPPPGAPFELPKTQTCVPDPGKLDLVFYVGHGLEPWTPETWAETGMGGSETMAWEMARRLRKLGHRVRLYGHCSQAQEGLYEGVEWLDASRYQNVSCDVLVASRRPEVVDDGFGLQATARVLWVHDIHCGPAFDFKRQSRFDRILCLSNWHRDFFHETYRASFDKAKIVVTRNGIDLTRFEGTEERKPHRAIYSSSPDRGLLAAVLAWPKVRESVPDAELHVFYGWQYWEATGATAQVRELKELCEKTPGIVLRGRVNQKELAREFMRSGVWCYPTWFDETSCITAMEAQAAGCELVTSPIAALPETAGQAVRSWVSSGWDYPNPPSAGYLQDVTDTTVVAMRMAERGLGCAGDPRRFSLSTLADDWDRMLLELHAELKENVMPRFQGAAE